MRIEIQIRTLPGGMAEPHFFFFRLAARRHIFVRARTWQNSELLFGLPPASA
jgi:hypothetical protein